ncbi:alpha/beta hydrolase family protein [Tundrisphaera sp. TA3]|uniref:alpha/beta hydrolase family protein n=1 Tax=Tundrisphaera sp. TA3 TaxID=3435775 RepID=UPI003EB9672F
MIALALAFSLAVATPPADELRVLDEAARPREMLGDWLRAEAGKHFRARREAVAALKTPEAWQARQRDLRGKFLASLGAFPERTPLNPRVTGRDRRDGYTVERVVFESRPDHHVTALLYLPEASGPVPGVLLPCGHSAEGKAGETYQRASITLARNGLAVLCFDPFGQGERVQILDAKGKPAIKGSVTEHTMAGVGALLVGRQAAHYRIWDGLRAMDYLAGRPEVDPTRLGCTGNSGGGTETAYLMALDDRIAVAAPSCYITSLERLFATIGPQDAEQNITGQVAFGMDHADYVTMRAPKPTLLCVGTQDFFDIDGAWASFREAKLAYGRFGFGERVDLFESDEPHGFTGPRRTAAMRWMRRWLLGKDDAPVEVDATIATLEQAQATAKGQVVQEFPGERSVFALNAERADELDRSRVKASAGRTMDAIREAIRTRLAVPTNLRPVIVSGQDRTIRRSEYSVDRWSVTTEPGITVPVLLLRGDRTDGGKPLAVYVGADRTMFEPGGAIESRVRAGEQVALVEPRGMGETTPAPPTRLAFGPDEREAFLALHLGRPLIGMRVLDVLQALRALDGGRGFHLVGVGAGGPIALHAAILDDRVRSVEIDGSILSWSAVAHAGITRDQLASAVPGVLESYDLPELAAALAPRPLTIRSPIDPDGRPAARETVDAALAPVIDAFRSRDSADRLTIRVAP